MQNIKIPENNLQTSSKIEIVPLTMASLEHKKIKTNAKHINITGENPNYDISEKLPFFKEIKSKKSIILLDQNKMYNLEVSSKTGNIKLTDFQSNIIEVQTKAGKIKIRNCILDTLNIISETGNIELENIIAKQMNISSITGQIEAENIMAVAGKFQSNQGSIQVTAIATSKYLNLNSETGDIKVAKIVAPMYKVFSQNGSISSQETTFASAQICSTNGNVDINIVNGGDTDYITSKKGNSNITYRKK